MGEVALIQYHHGVPDVPVLELHLHYRPRWRPATSPFDWSGPRSRPRQKRHPISPWLVPAPVYLISLLPQPPFSHTVLVLAMRHHWPLCQLLPVLWAWDPPPLLLLKTPPLSRHPPGVGLVCPYPGRPERPAHQPHGLAGVRPQSHPVKHPCQQNERWLEPSRVRGSDHPITSIKNLAFTVSCWCTSSTHCLPSLRSRIVLNFVCDPYPLSLLLLPPSRSRTIRDSQ